MGARNQEGSFDCFNKRSLDLDLDLDHSGDEDKNFFFGLSYLFVSEFYRSFLPEAPPW